MTLTPGTRIGAHEITSRIAVVLLFESRRSRHTRRRVGAFAWTALGDDLLRGDGERLLRLFETTIAP